MFDYLHYALMYLTTDMPMKTIVVNNKPYLERYFVKELANGEQVWLHRFLSNDSEEHLHTHPWNAVSFIISGQYVEQREEGVRGYHQGDNNQIKKTTLHRIIEVQPNTWTLMFVDPDRSATWDFIEKDGSINTQQASPSDWYKTATPRK